MKKYIYLLILALPSIISCDSQDDPLDSSDMFDRQAMLQHWADNIIVPGYEEYTSSVNLMADATAIFVEEPTISNLTELRNSWIQAYTNWQRVSMFEVGPAATASLRDFTNVFPTNPSQIETNIESDDYNLALPSSRTAQGFPAIEYLLFTPGASEEQVVDRFTSNQNNSMYLQVLVLRLASLSMQVQDAWKTDYREVFINNDGTSASSSVNTLVNDFMFYYEKSLRAGKIGIPAGVFSNTPLSDRVEGLYSRIYSKDLFLTSLQATRDFFNGKYTAGTGVSLKDYLDFTNAFTGGEALSTKINLQFDAAIAQGNLLSSDLYNEVESNNVNMLLTYDELQKNVILMKVDMFQALNIKVDFVDADGD